MTLTNKHAKRLLSSLLAVIHCDGGHYESEHGTEQAVNDALEKYYARGLALTQANDENAKLERELAAAKRHIAALGETLRASYPQVMGEFIEWKIGRMKP